MLSVAVAQSSSDDNVIRYVLPVLLMTSCLHIIGEAGYSKGQKGGEVPTTAIVLFLLDMPETVSVFISHCLH